MICAPPEHDWRRVTDARQPLAVCVRCGDAEVDTGKDGNWLSWHDSLPAIDWEKARACFPAPSQTSSVGPFCPICQQYMELLDHRGWEMTFLCEHCSYAYHTPTRDLPGQEMRRWMRQ